MDKKAGKDKPIRGDKADKGTLQGTTAKFTASSPRASSRPAFPTGPSSMNRRAKSSLKNDPTRRENIFRTAIEPQNRRLVESLNMIRQHSPDLNEHLTYTLEDRFGKSGGGAPGNIKLANVFSSGSNPSLNLRPLLIIARKGGEEILQLKGQIRCGYKAVDVTFEKSGVSFRSNHSQTPSFLEKNNWERRLFDYTDEELLKTVCLIGAYLDLAGKEVENFLAPNKWKQEKKDDSLQLQENQDPRSAGSGDSPLIP